jgi:hypothetical protein
MVLKMTHQARTLLDIARVPAEGDPLRAVVPVDPETPARDVECEVLVVGGGLGGVAAAWAASRRGRTVCLLEETDWLGGQVTSQGVSALDEHEYIEAFGGTRTYYQLRETIRDHYRRLSVQPGLKEPLNPGDCWVTRLAFEPVVAVRTLEALLAPEVEAGRLRVFLRTKTASVEMEGDRAVSLRAVSLEDGSAVRFRFQYVLDATELGDLLPLTDAEYGVGAESVEETGEPHAQPETPRPHCVQSCTYTFALENRPAGEHNRIPKPQKYEHYRDTQPYSLRIHVHGGEIYGEQSGWLEYQVFRDMPGTKGPLWTYRRLIASDRFRDRYPHDITMFNWPGTDYRDRPLVDQTPEDLARVLQDAKRVGLGFAYWLQTDAPNPGGPPGFPHLALRRDVMGSADGLSKHPYIRECRRIKALKTVVEQEVAVAYQPGPRAAHFDDSVGVGWYPIDIHQAGEGDVGVSARTRPFQIPLGALIPRRVENLIAANKNIGTTHITNGCYRLHPVEWNIGEAAGGLAAFALESGRLPKAIREEQALLRSFQRGLAADGVPLSWLVDVPVTHRDFAAIQRLALAGGGGEDRLDFQPDGMISPQDRAVWVARASGPGRPDPCGAGPVSRAAFAAAAAQRGLT